VGFAEQKRAKVLFQRKQKGKDGQQTQGGKIHSELSIARHPKEYGKPEEVRKKRLQELQEKQRLSRERELMKRRSLDSFQRDILERQREFEQRETEMQSLEKHVNFENENSRKAYYREFKKVVEASDVILEVLDARDPLGCRCPQVEQAVIQSGTDKKIVLVLNKIDLVSKEIVEKWIKYLRNEFPTVAFKASTQQQNKNLKRSNVPVTQATAELLGSSACVGAECLMKLLGNYCRNLDIKTAITVGVVGFPNVGKSSLINSLKRARACNVGATPGVTKKYTWTSTSNAAIRHRKGGVPDNDKAAKSVLMDWTGGRISYFTHPPETHTLPTHISAEIVAEMGKAFDWEELEKGNQEVLAVSSCTDVQMGFYMATAGMTQGGQEEPPCDLEMEGALDEVESKDETESMDDDQDPEFGPMTVEIKAPRAKTGGSVDAAAPRTLDLKDIWNVDPLQQGQALVAAGKKRKKQQKRADKIATKLSDSLTTAMNFAFSDI
uniref:G protein nucleolar 3 like n=1 Tax=Hucho hucho TaxID=62062 RepID=A0A4W5JPX7_9TELE